MLSTSINRFHQNEDARPTSAISAIQLSSIDLEDNYPKNAEIYSKKVK